MPRSHFFPVRCMLSPTRLALLLIVAFVAMVWTINRPDPGPFPVGEQGAEILLADGWYRSGAARPDRIELEHRGKFKGTTIAILQVQDKAVPASGDFNAARTLLTVFQTFGGLQPTDEEFILPVDRRSLCVVTGLGELDGENITVRMGVVGEYGLSFAVAAVSEGRQASLGKEALEQVMAGFRFPDADDAWTQEVAPRPLKLELGDSASLSLDYSPGLWNTAHVAPDELLELVSMDRRGRCRIQAASYGSLGAAIAAGRAELEEEYGATSFFERVPLEVDGREGVLCRYKIGTFSQAHAHLAVIPTGPDSQALASFRVSGEPSDLNWMVDRLLASVQFAGLPDTQVALPPPPDPLDEDELAFLEACEKLGDLPEYVDAVYRVGDHYTGLGRPFAYTLYPDSGTTQVQEAKIGWSHDGAVVRGVLLFLNEDDEVRTLREDGAKLTRIEADALAAGPVGTVVIARNHARGYVPGDWWSRGPGHAELVVRDRGRDNDSTRIPFGSVRSLQEDLDCNLILVVTSQVGRQGTKMHCFDAVGGNLTELGEWDWVQSHAPAPHGWLVQGTPLGGEEGLYYLHADGALELLIDLDIKPVDLAADGVVTFVSPFETPPAFKPREPQFALLRMQMEELKEWKRRFGAASAEDLDAIAEQARPLPGSATPWSAWEAALARADAACEARTGTPLPRHAKQLDRWIVRHCTREGLSEASQWLLSAMIMRFVIDQGGEHLPGPPSASAHRSGIPLDRLDVLGLHPEEILRSAASYEGEWWKVATEIAEMRNGRTLWVGNSARAMLDAAEQLPDLHALVQTAVLEGSDDLIQLFGREPANAHLREHAYRLLAIANQPDLRYRAARTAWESGHGQPIDLLNWAEAAWSLAKDVAPMTELIQPLEAALLEDPVDADLALQLARALERQGLQVDQGRIEGLLDTVREHGSDAIKEQLRYWGR